ncbi:nicotinate phosphoribosyltransferase [Roseibium sp. RKSG952]|uniref:nicotinate phosphoribosyltransferase n=1 Tax=Roseibium sp. RKSG952 TaxID=2529384 RepID=UPI0012BC5669|nr:nicotinate phosphoribosyltransferase [Roseibium sp. RKSG952]MTH95008.1 nicotinate phosphoribosyltransferase [Roseibium sp. RKSG952]
MKPYNWLADIDSYKDSHFLMLPPGTEYVSSYIEARVGGKFNEVVVAGLQPFLDDYMEGSVIDQYDIDEAEELTNEHGLPFNRVGAEIMLNEYGGIAPLEIRSLPEGLVVPAGTPMVQAVNTDPRFAFLTSARETPLLRAVWYPSTVATYSREAKKVIWKNLVETSDDPGGQIGFKLHDFGARGTTCYEQSVLGGMAHLINFMGTDTKAAVRAVNYYYDEKLRTAREMRSVKANFKEFIAGYSVPASEHSVVTSWGPEKELEFCRHLLNQFPSGIVSSVSDSYDLWDVIDRIWGEELKNDVEKRDGTIVIRPDSGDPVDVVIRVLKKLEAKFSSTMNSKGYRVLPPYIRVIQGDGIDIFIMGKILNAMKLAGFSGDNIVFGMGGGLLQKVNRDDARFAMKANAIRVDGKWQDVQKKPATDPSKASKAGRQEVLVTEMGDFVARRYASESEMSPNNMLELRWRNGKRFNQHNFSSVRERANVGFELTATAAAA